jgi:PhnB protein
MKETTSRPHFTPQGWPTVVPRIVAPEAQQLVEFIKHVFEATGEYQAERPTVLSIGNSMIMISEAGIRDSAPAFLYVYVPDTDEACRRAVTAGARSMEEPWNLPYGDRRGMVQDRWGNIWQIATHLGNAGS